MCSRSMCVVQVNKMGLRPITRLGIIAVSQTNLFQFTSALLYLIAALQEKQPLVVGFQTNVSSTQI